MRLQRGFVLQEMIERPVQPVLVDEVIAQSQQIRQRRALEPILGDVQFARRLAKTRRHQDRGDRRPWHRFLAARQQPVAKLRQPCPAPQRQSEIDVAKLPRALDANALQPHGHRDIRLAVVEQVRLFRRADQAARQRAGPNLTARIEFAKMRHRSLDNASAMTLAAHETPVAMRLGVLPANRVAQIHAPSQPTPNRSKKGVGRHDTRFCTARISQSLDLHEAGGSIKTESFGQLRKLG
jgi:hypothetical protein